MTLQKVVSTGMCFRGSRGSSNPKEHGKMGFVIPSELLQVTYDQPLLRRSP